MKSTVYRNIQRLFLIDFFVGLSKGLPLNKAVKPSYGIDQSCQYFTRYSINSPGAVIEHIRTEPVQYFSDESAIHRCIDNIVIRWTCVFTKILPHQTSTR